MAEKKRKTPAGMDTYITRAVAIVGLIGGVLGIFAFFRADATMEAFRHRGKLKVSGQPPIMRIDVPAEGAAIIVGDETTANVTYAVAELEIDNIGDLPAKDVQIAATYRSQSTIEEPVFSPPLPTQKLTQGNTVFYTLQRPIAPKSHLAVTLTPAPTSVSVTDENGESSTLYFAPSASVKFVGIDTTTQGNWKGVYGSKATPSPRWP
jgi:hypothetical protein